MNQPNPSRHAATKALCAISLLGPAFVARAQAWPANPVRIVHGYDSGSNPDTVVRARLLGIGSEPVGGTVEELRTRVETDIRKWKELSRTAKLDG